MRNNKLHEMMSHVQSHVVIKIYNAPIVETKFLELVFTRLFTSNTPWYFLDFALYT